MSKKHAFQMPAKSDLKGRTSTITNAFAISITPYIRPNENELNEYYRSLEIKPGICAYCLKESTSSDHYHSIIKNKRPSGYITDLSNLIPCCSRCNSSKGSKDFEEWYLSSKNIKRLQEQGLSTKLIQERYKIITEHVKRFEKKPLNYEQILGKDLWKEYEIRRTKMINILKDNQEFCDKLAKIIKDKISPKS